MTPLEISEYLLEQRKEEMQDMTPKHIFHNSNTYTHTLRVAYHANILNSELSLSYSEFQQLSTACFAHDLGKVETWNPEGSPWFRGHEEVSADLLVANGFDKDDDIVNAVRYHGRLQQFDKMGDKARRKLVNKISNLKLFIMLQLCDANGFSDYGKKQALNQLNGFIAYYLTTEFNDGLPNWLKTIITQQGAKACKNNIKQGAKIIMCDNKTFQ
jgi:hypothetical protein